MKKLILLISVAVSLIGSIFIFTSFTSSLNTEGLVYVRTFECFNAMYPSSILITDGNTVIKTVELEAMRVKSQAANIVKISSELNELKKQGYVLISSSGGANEGVLVTNYVLEKK